MATLSIDNVTKRFGNTEVIHGVSIDIDDGEFIVIVGPSGCGKSTLLRMVAGLETVTSGCVKINDVDVNDKEPMDRDIAMVFQNYALYPHMSVRANMAYGLKIRKASKSHINQKVEEAASLLQLSEYLDRKPRQLSGGQRQRVAMGRAIVREPSVFLFDEPLSNLDAKLRVQMRLEIKQLQANLGVTSLYVTHDQVEAMTMADRMIVMNEGFAEQIGTPLEVYENPASLFSAQFIGSPAMNVLDGQIVDQRVRLSNGAELPVSAELLPDKSFKGQVHVGVRPEHLRIDERKVIGDMPSEGALLLNIQSAEALGATTLIHGLVNGLNEPFTVSLPGIFHDALSGTVNKLSIVPQKLHLFSKDTGKRLS